MSRAQGIRTLFIGKRAAPQTCTLRMTSSKMADLRRHGLRAETERRLGTLSGIALPAIGHQP